MLTKKAPNLNKREQKYSRASQLEHIKM